MSVMIKGMDMPKSCHDCDLFSGEGFLCPLVIETINDWIREVMYKRVDECLLVEIPTPHGRLIDADDLYNKFKNEYCNRNCGSSVQGKKCDHCGVPRALNIILNAPTIIEAEVSE